MLKTCPVCGRQMKSLYLHQRTHEAPVIHSDGLKVKLDGTREEKDLYVLENNELEELRRAGIPIPEWRLNSKKYPFFKLPRR